MKIITSVLAIGVLMLAAVSPAFGQTLDSYRDSAGQQQGQVQGGLEDATGPVQGQDDGGDAAGAGTQPAAASEDAAGGSLPFTGLDVALLVGAGALLVTAGFGMRRLTRAPSSV